ncbi:MAG: hypothetical protein KF830_06720 [Planctomycetes bacterium]|nr:hypothetical protein [Planctomycetota bacterium]
MLRHLLPFALLLPALAAQTTTTPPHLRLVTVGPDGWRARFAPTNLGSLLESAAGRALWEPKALPWLGAWQQRLGGAAAFAPVRERCLGYGGRLELHVWLERGQWGGSDLRAATLVLEGDGRTDLDALAADLRGLLDEAPGTWSKVEVGGESIEVREDGEFVLTAPRPGPNHLLLVAARREALATELAQARAAVGTLAGKPPAPAAPALQFEVALPAWFELQRGPDAAAGEAEAWQALGVDCLGTASLSLSTAGPHVRGELAQGFREPPRGLFAALCPPAGAPTLQRLVPPGRSTWKAGVFDFVALHDVVTTALASRHADTAEIRADLRERLGVDLRDDLLAHLGTEVLFVGGEGFADFDRLDRMPWALAVRLRDRGAFEPNLGKALAKARPMLSRAATVEHGPAKLHRYGAFGYDLWFAVDDGLFVLAGGDDAEARLTALFDAARKPAAGPADADAGSLPAPFAALQRHLPPGLTGLAEGDLDSLAAMPAGLWLELVDDMVPWSLRGDGGEADDPAALRALLAAHGLDVVRTATGFRDGTWRWRLFW